MEPIALALALAEFAPSIIKWVTGNEKAAQAAEAVVDVAKKVTGAETGEGALEALKANPDLVLQFKAKLLDASVEIEKAHLADTADARKMQVAALQQDDLFSKRFVYFFSAAWSVYAMVYIMDVTMGRIPKDNVQIVYTVLGFLLGTAIASIFNFFLGTTMRNSKKDDTMNVLSTLLK